ncbi:hypothetical protein ABZ671_01260 [Micromonospora sp. NPDC006766]|uniref:hypothetical protein n=1 Tax=Micromonospora sp. NPDC006766 TaxID=3154778 RepID=UPI0033DEC2F0
MMTAVNLIARGICADGREAAAGRVRPQLAALLAAADSYQVAAVQGRWTLDMHWWARVAIHAGYGVCAADPDGRPVLALTDAGRDALAQARALRDIHSADAVNTAAYRAGYMRASADIVAYRRKRRLRRLVGRLAGVVFLLAAGAAAGIAATHGL